MSDDAPRDIFSIFVSAAKAKRKREAARRYNASEKGKAWRRQYETDNREKKNAQARERRRGNAAHQRKAAAYMRQYRKRKKRATAPVRDDESP